MTTKWVAGFFPPNAPPVYSLMRVRSTGLTPTHCAMAGQVCARSLRQLYRSEKLTKSTKVFGVIADPVQHSISPAVHNRARLKRSDAPPSRSSAAARTATSSSA